MQQDLQQLQQQMDGQQLQELQQLQQKVERQLQQQVDGQQESEDAESAHSYGRDELMAMRPRDVKALMMTRRIDCAGACEKGDLVERLLAAQERRKAAEEAQRRGSK